MKQLIALVSAFVLIAGVKAQSAGAVVAPLNPQNLVAKSVTFNGAVIAPLNPQSLAANLITYNGAVIPPLNPQVAPSVPVTAQNSAAILPSPVNLLARH